MFFFQGFLGCFLRVLAACASPLPSKDARINDLGCFDCVLDTLRGVSFKFVAEHKIVVLGCRNGAHRSAFLLAMLLLMITDANVGVEQDLNSSHESKYRGQKKPPPKKYATARVALNAFEKKIAPNPRP